MTGCQRPALSTRKRLCRAHHWQRTRTLGGIALEVFLRRADVVALHGFGDCAVLACPRTRHSSGTTVCRAHEGAWKQASTWTRPWTSTPVATTSTGSSNAT